MIKLLSEETINKIAAGEVIERPANVVKELVENSLDAKSENLEIQIEGAGRELIRIKDDGFGMEKEDLLKSCLRHATSKISKFEDLISLSTLGFRGEALASIAAVSNLVIQSQPKGRQSGWEIRLSGGKLKDSRAFAGSGGTIVEVNNLFFNTPAREKFLKSDATEKSRIIRLIEEISLSRPDISFKVIADGKTVLSAPKTKNILERIADVLGSELALNLIPVEVSHPNGRIKAFITKREYSLPNKNSQFLFVNGRPVSFPKTISYAVFEAYKENLQVGRSPGVIIFLELKPEQIDVNIHPTKREVRFSQEQEIKQLLYSAIKKAVSESGMASIAAEKNRAQKPFGGDFRSSADNFEYSNRFHGSSRTGFTIQDLKKVYGSEKEFAAFSPNRENFRILGQLNNLYIICQMDNSMLIIDQHAAEERIKYEEYFSQWQKKRIPVQPLLFPVTVELSPSQNALLKENIEVLRNLGIEAEDFGGKTLRITGLPAVLGPGREVNDILLKIIDALLEGSKMPAAEKIENIIRAACRSSVKAGDSLAPLEMNKLVKALFQCRSHYTCPHGRPTSFKVSLNELEKYFGRK